jgi:hypothetical protein
LVVLYRASPDYAKLADSTRKTWSPWLDRISEHFGDLRIAQFDRPEKIRPVIRRWRNQWADKPRTADFGMQVLSRVLSTLSARLPVTRARESSGFTGGTVRKSFGQTQILPR